MRNATSLRAITALAIAVAACFVVACGRSGETAVEQRIDPNVRPVSGRTATKAGISFVFPEGWSEVPLHGPFTQSFEGAPTRLNLDVSDFPSNDQSVQVAGQRLQQQIGHDGEVLESGPIVVDGHQAYRVFVRNKSGSGSRLVYGLVIGRRPDRFTTVFVSTQGDEIGDQRSQITDLISTIEVEE